MPLVPFDDVYLTSLEITFPPMHIGCRRALHERIGALLGCIALLQDHLSPCALGALASIPCVDSVSVVYCLSAVLFDCEKAGRGVSPGACGFPTVLHRLRLAHELTVPRRGAEGPRSGVSNGAHVARPGGPNGAPRGGARPHGADGEARSAACAVRVVYWAVHFTKLEKMIELGRRLGEFAAGRMLMRLETLRCLGRVDVAKAAPASARDWLEVRIDVISATHISYSVGTARDSRQSGRLNV